MGIFSNSPFDADVEKATDGKSMSENWNLILDICDKVGGSSATNAKDCLKSIVKRLNNPDPHIIMHALTLLDACVLNCGRPFHLEIASRDFEAELKRLITKSDPKIIDKVKQLLKKWAEGEFKDNPQLDLIPSLYNKLKQEGCDFTSLSDPGASPPRSFASQPRPSQALSKDPNVVQSQKEEDDIAKAIELSLKDQSSPKASSSGSSASSSLYPSTNLKDSTSSETRELRKVRALYDFEAAEDNELTFKAGEIIFIIDNSDPNWWKGKNFRGEGLFPANFVSTEVYEESEGASSTVKIEKKTVQFNDEVEVKELLEEEPPKAVAEINEVKMQRLLHLLHEADPNGTEDSPEMLRLEDEVNAMGPLIDAELERVDRKHAQLTQLSTDLVEALNLYHTLMREPPQPFPGHHHTLPKQSAPPQPPYHPGYGPPPPHHMFNGPAPPMPPHGFVQHTLPSVTTMGSYVPPPESIPIYGSIPSVSYPNMMTPGAPPPTPPMGGPPMPPPMGSMPPNLSMLPPHLQQPPPQPPGPLPHEYANKYALGH